MSVKHSPSDAPARCRLQVKRASFEKEPHEPGDQGRCDDMRQLNMESNKCDNNGSGLGFTLARGDHDLKIIREITIGTKEQM